LRDFYILPYDLRPEDLPEAESSANDHLGGSGAPGYKQSLLRLIRQPRHKVIESIANSTIERKKLLNVQLDRFLANPRQVIT
jgi:hypothetical protein